MKLTLNKKILIIGGNGFLGKYIVHQLDPTNSNITIFCRNTPALKFFKACSFILGDRNSHDDLKRVFNKSFDIVIDLCCYSKS